MDLTQLKEELTNGTRSAEHYLQKFGADVISTLKNTVTVLAPEEQEQKTSTSTDSIKTTPRIYATRKDGLIAKMQMNENTYLKDPEFSKTNYEQEKKVFDTFNSSFSIEEYTEEIAQLLNDYPDLREMMDKLVPIQVSYALFWQRYFYHAWKIEQDEQKRQLIVKQQETDEEADFKWDSDDEDPASINDDNKSSDTKVDENKTRDYLANNLAEDTDDFSHISSTSTSSPLKATSQAEDDWIKAEKKKSDEEDSDSDWEYPKPNFPNDNYPLFVTWHKRTNDGQYQLRGCIGNFNPMSLHEGLKKYALISALRDQRFKPITLSEIPSLTCAVSLLTNFEIADNYLDWEIGKHGIWIEFTQPDGQKETATYLPEVMSEQGWTKQEAIKSLLRKGGYYSRITEDYCKNFIILTRYQSVKCEIGFDGEVIQHE
ncbi:AMMECR1 domain-containing protein [Cokeromyces recurvatus]|uniref:AMMECR1 domain-containing protein n=1 Tax=Cokeromyces recurvatus TaxID=90255 RepID=UPI00221F7E5A|nr:AMMECR1 domain-containing protein [Cokeromyces recurvatus]KAI7903650.1 AMMECR1 domain-containing protein [Cokeromyces recurvatus]